MKKIFVLLPLAAIALAGCRKDDPEPVKPEPPDLVKGSLVVDFRNMVDDKDLVFDQYYLSPRGDSFKVSKFNYYISNVVLEKEGGGEYVQPESYFVVRHTMATKQTIPRIPNGTYTAIRFLVGVDSLRNTSGAQTGGLDVAKNGDMFWSWNSGYIFMKLEGSSPQSGADSKALTFHIGGFKGAEKAQRPVKITFQNNPVVINDNAATVRLKADVNSLFAGPHDVSFADLYHLMQPGPGAAKLADNYADMFSLENVIN